MKLKEKFKERISNLEKHIKQLRHDITPIFIVPVDYSIKGGGKEPARDLQEIILTEEGNSLKRWAGETERDFITRAVAVYNSLSNNDYVIPVFTCLLDHSAGAEGEAVITKAVSYSY